MKRRKDREEYFGIDHQDSTDRLAWTTTLFQGMGNGLEASKHRIVHKNGETIIIRDYNWTAEANKV